MTDSSKTDFDRQFLENAQVADIKRELQLVNVVAGNNDKKDIKVSEEGVAKLTFAFLDDMQGGDSSLEPGEVKTPPPGSSPVIIKESTPSRLALERPEPPAKHLTKETLAKAFKTVSQLEAEACEEKVRAILELDAKQRKEEVEKRKLEAEKRRQSGETDLEMENKRKAKEERKKLKKLKKAKKAAEQALVGLEEDNEKKPKKRKLKKPTESEESEGLCSSGGDSDEIISVKSEKHSTVLNSTINVSSVPSLRYQPHLPLPHLLPEAFMGGFRPMNPFMRGPRPDFPHVRGGFMPRGRGGLRGRMPFQGFRPPFFPTSSISGGGQLKFNIPHGPHGIQQQRQPHTPPPHRGHSPILPPTSDLQWTKCKPSLSYAFKFNKEQKFHSLDVEVKSQHQNRTTSDENWDDEYPETVDGQLQDSQKEQTHKRDKKYKKVTKERKKSKKQREKNIRKSKRSTILLKTASSSMKHKKKSKNSSRKQIEKIRKSYGSSNRSTPTQQQTHSSEDTETTNENPIDKKIGSHYQQNNNIIGNKSDEDEKMPNEEEIRNKVENIKKEKVESIQLNAEDFKLKVKPLIMVKTEPPEMVAEKKEENAQTTKNESGKEFDIFAETSPISILTSNETNKRISPALEKKTPELGSVTPPLPPLNDAKGQKVSTLQSALEIQKRIDKLLQQDDIKLEAIEAAKDLLMKKAQKYQSAKEKLTPEQESHKSSEQKAIEEAKAHNNKEEISSIKEKPKAYKDKESSTTADSSKDRENNTNSSKHRENKGSKSNDRHSSSSFKDKSKNVDKNDKRNKNESRDKDKDIDKDKNKAHKSEKEDYKNKSRSSNSASTYRNPFKRSLSRDNFFSKIDSRRHTRTKSRERELSSKRRLSHDRKRADSSGYSSGRISSKRRISGSSAASTVFNRSKSGDRDDSFNSKEKDRKDKKTERTSEPRHKRKRSSSPKRHSEKSNNTKQGGRASKLEHKSTTPPRKLVTNNVKSQENFQSKENKKSKSPVKSIAKKRPLSFTQTEFLFPEDGNEDDFILADDEETNDSLKNESDKEDSPDTDDYMDNWENDEDVDLDMNSNMPIDMSTPQKLSPDLIEEDSFVARFVNPSPPKEIMEKNTKTNVKLEDELENNSSQPLTPPLDLLKKLTSSTLEPKETQKENKKCAENKKPELFGMQELYDQFIKSVEATGVSLKTANKEKIQEFQQTLSKNVKIPNIDENDIKIQNDRGSTSSTSTSSSTSSSSSSSSDSNSSSNSSSSSSSESSSEDSNDGQEFTKAVQQSTKTNKLEKSTSPKHLATADKISNDAENISAKSPKSTDAEIRAREPRTPSPLPLQKSVLINQTPPTPSSQNKVTTPKTDAAKDFKKLKNLEANLSRIQMMRANYDSNDEISEELHKMEMLFLQEKKIILQKYAKSTQAVNQPASATASVSTTTNAKTTSELTPALQTNNEFAILPPPPPPEEPNKIFDANREAIKLTISPLKLSSKPSIFNVSVSDETEKKATDDKDEMDFTEKLVKPVKEVAIVKPMMETKEVKESRTRDSHRHRRSPAYSGSRERQRSPNNYRDRNRRSNSRNRLSPQRRGRGRSLSLSPPRRGLAVRHGTPPRRGAASGRFRASNRRSRSRSRSPLRQFGNRRGKEESPFRRKRGSQQDAPSHYRKYGRHRGSRSRSPRSPQTRPRSPRTPPPRRRSYSPDPYSRSPLPFKPPSPPMRRSHSPMGSPGSPSRRSRSPSSPRRPRSPRSPRSPVSPRSPLSPRSPDSQASNRYDDHRYRRESSFERHSSISPHPQYYGPDSLTTGTSSQASSYYYNVSPSRISLDARINIVLNTPSGGGDAPAVGYEGYTNYAQYGGAAYMSIPPQPMANTAGNMGYYPNSYVPLMAAAHDSHHPILPPHAHGLHQTTVQQSQQQHPPAYSAIPTINSGTSGQSSPLPPNNFYYNDYNVGHQPVNPVLKELPKAPVAVQKGNVLEIVPSNVETGQSGQNDNKTKTSPVLIETIKNHIDKIASISWRDEVNNRHVKSAVMRLNRGNDNATRSILKRSVTAENPEQTEKKKVYFEDGIYPSRDSDDEDRKLIEYKIRKQALRLRKKRGIDIPAARDLIESKVKLQKPKIEAILDKLPPPPPPTIMPAANCEQPIYLRPPTPVPLVYFHFDSVVHSMYVSQLEKPIPPRLLNPKCVPPGPSPAPTSGSANVGPGGISSAAPNHSPNLNLSSGGITTKKELSTLAALNRVGRNENVINSPKTVGDTKRESPNSPQQSPIINLNKPSGIHFAPTQTSPHMSPLHGPPIRHPTSPIGFVGMRINNFMRLPPSPLARATLPPHMTTPPPHMVNLPPGIVGMRHPHYNMPPPNLMPPGMPPEGNYNPVVGGAPYGPPPGFQGYGQRPVNPGYFMGPASAHTMHLPPPMPINLLAKEQDHILQHPKHHQHHHPPHPHPHIHHPHHLNQHNKHPPPVPTAIGSGMIAASPQAKIAPYNVKKTVN